MIISGWACHVDMQDACPKVIRTVRSFLEVSKWGRGVPEHTSLNNSPCCTPRDPFFLEPSRYPVKA